MYQLKAQTSKISFEGVGADVMAFQAGVTCSASITEFFVEAQIVVPPPQQIEQSKYAPTAES